MGANLLPKGLNPQQLEAVKTTEGNLLVLAGAGTGKTRVVTERIAYLLRKGVKPENILAVTFTNKAAGEMKERVAKLAGRKADLSAMIVSTFHSLAVRILREDCAELGYFPGFTIADQGEQFSLVRKAARTVRGGAGVKPEDLLGAIGDLKNRGLLPAAAARAATEPWEHTLASVYRRYQEALKAMNTFDFDDLLLKTLELLQLPALRQRWGGRFRYVMVDEFQDTNEVQLRLVEALSSVHGNLCVVGDDDQSIYGWRGAVAGNILGFGERFRGAKTVRLEQNYRSVCNILKAANAVIARNEKRNEKNLWSALGDGEKLRLTLAEDQDDEALRVADEIKGRIGREGLAPSDFAIIVRTNAQTRPFEQELGANRIPYVVVGGQSFFDNKEVKDVVAYLTAVANPRADAALLRILNTPARGIGDRCAEELAKSAAAKGIPFSRALAEAEQVPGLTKKSAAACAAFARELEGWRELARGGGLQKLVERIVADSGYEREVEHLYDDPMQRAARINLALEVGESLRRFLKGSDGAGLREFLQEAALWGKTEEKKEDADRAAVRIITVHSAKGLEFPVVYLAGVEEGLMPHKTSEEDGSVEEERRLFYVALTRARRELRLSRCECRLFRGKKKQCAPSRFIEEIPAELLECRGGAVSAETASKSVSDMLARWAAAEE